MEFTVDRNELADAVTYAVNGIPNNPVTPIRAGMLIHPRNGCIAFTGSDGDVTFTGKTDVTFPGDEITVPGKLFADVVRTLPDKPVHFVTENLTATLNCGRVQFKFPVYKEEYPSLPDPVVATGSVDSDMFGESVRKVIPAASRSDSNPALASVYLEPAGDTLWAVATDRYRLAAVQVPWYPLDVLGPVLIPSWAADKFTRNIEGTVSLGWDDRVATFTCGTRWFTSRVWAGEFPAKWRAMLPQILCTVEVSTEDLLGALKRAELASEADSPVELTFSHDRLHVEAGYGNHADDVLDTTYHGKEFKVLFGIRYLTDGLTGCGPVACFGFTEPDRPVYITSGGYTYTVLPRKPM